MKFKQLSPKVILGVAAHPDDLEFTVAGSVAKWVSQGAKVYYLILTNGNKGSDDRSLSSNVLMQTRRKEQLKAGRILGLTDVFFCNYDDGALENSQEVKCEVVRTIRKVKPDVMLTLDPTLVYSESRGFINHSDHRAAGQAALDAVYPLARDHLSFPELCNNEKLEPHKVMTVLLVNFDRSNFYVDITDHIETKLKAIAAHSSQLPKKSKPTIDIVRQRAMDAGKQSGCKYAEQFIRLDLPF